jgi:branched-chain amino acid transport system substrate-binding protein
MRGLRMTAVVAAALIVVAACGSGSGGSGPKTLKIGFTASQTGAQELTSRRQVEGIKLWADQVTKAGGIKLKDGTVLTPQLVSYDDESKTDRVQALYTKLINDDKVDFLLSPYSSGLIKAAAVVGEQNGKVMVTAGGADDATMEQGFTSIYQVYTPASQYLTGAIDLMLAMDPSIKKIAIVNEKDAFSTGVAAAAKPYAAAKGLEVVVDEGYDTGTTDFAPIVNKIAATAPDAILGGGHFQDGQTFAKAIFDKQVAAKFVALLVAPPEPTFADIGKAAIGIVGPSQWETSVSYDSAAAAIAGVTWYGSTVADFAKAYQTAYSAAPSYHSAGGYAAGLVLQKAIEDAGSVDPAAVRAALDKQDLLTLFGRIKFSTDAKTHGKQVAHQMVYVQWQAAGDGLASQVVWPEAARTSPILPRQ